MAKRSIHCPLSDLFPELAAAWKVAEGPARKARKIDDTPRALTKHEEKWNTHLELCKEWKRTKGRFPKNNRKDKEEMKLYNWLRRCKPGGDMWTHARWEMLNVAFGVGWEKECFPNA